jgi:CRISPR-associated protein Cmr6
MALPLYNKHDAPEDRPKQGNAGLWYDKFCNQWCRNRKLSGKESWTLESFRERQGKDEVTVSPKAEWIGSVVNSGRVGNSEQLEEHRQRMAKLLEHHSQSPLFYRLESDFVTGLGREHPVENGFAWHHTLGTPYLPGSSVKGMVRAWAEKWADPKPNQADIRRIFGPTADDIRKHEDVHANVGSIIFLDALPTKPVQLKADIMTPHYGPYYQGDEPPADWHSPNPIPFLVVGQGQTFVFGFIPRRNDEQSHADCKRVQAWLEETLEWTGAGAKTAVGYGRFTPDEKMLQKAQRQREERLREQQEREEEAQRKAELEQMSPILREMHEDGYETGGFLGEGMRKWLENLERAEGEEKVEIAQHLKTWYLRHRTDQWSKPNKKNAEKIAPIKKVLRES